jgi:hypothetical protein
MIMEWKPAKDILKDKEILIKTHVGMVSAWFDDQEKKWVCYDDMFTLDGDIEIEGWMDIDWEIEI